MYSTESVCADEGDGIGHGQAHLLDEDLVDCRVTQLRVRQAVRGHGAGNSVSSAKLEENWYRPSGS